MAGSAASTRKRHVHRTRLPIAITSSHNSRTLLSLRENRFLHNRKVYTVERPINSNGLKIFESIIYRYLISEHQCLPCDSEVEFRNSMVTKCQISCVRLQFNRGFGE